MPGNMNLTLLSGETGCTQSHSQRPRSFWSATGIATSGQVQHLKSMIHRLPVPLRMPRVKSDKSDWFWSRSTVLTELFKTGMSLDLARGPDFQRMTKGAPGTRVRMHQGTSNNVMSFKIKDVSLHRPSKLNLFSVIFIRVLHDLLRKSVLHKSAQSS